MIQTRTWTVEITINEHDDERRTYAVALLRTGDDTHLRGEGQARRRPQDVEIPQIGDELAAARALSDLAHRLLDAAAGDIEQITHRAPQLAS